MSNFVVEIGNADPNANSYASEEYADEYLSVNAYVADAWLPLTDDQRQKLLMRASKMLDTLVSWHGHRVDDDSGLRWPRYDAHDEDGFEIPDDVIPTILQDATCELAGYLISSDWSQTSQTRGIKQIEVDVIKIDMDPFFGRPSLPPYIITMLTPLGDVQRGNRPAFKRIVRS